MREHDLIDRTRQRVSEAGAAWDPCNLSAKQLDDVQRPCERWYAEREAEFLRMARGKFIAISYFDKVEMLSRGLGHIAKNWPSDERPYVLAQSELEMIGLFHLRFGGAGSYCRRVGDPIMEF
jgi:hypothetical protein